MINSSNQKDWKFQFSTYEFYAALKFKALAAPKNQSQDADQTAYRLKNKSNKTN